jgi:hypothetical protein
MDCHLGLCASCHHEKTLEAGREPLHNSTDYEHRFFEKTPILRALTDNHYNNKFTTGHMQLN